MYRSERITSQVEGTSLVCQGTESDRKRGPGHSRICKPRNRVWFLFCPLEGKEKSCLNKDCRRSGEHSWS